MKPFGIDLGTTNSAIAVLDEFGKPEIIPTDGERITPSVVAFPSDEPDKIFVGGEAKDNILQFEPDCVVTEVKRKIGTDAVYRFRGESYGPEQISAMVLKKLAEGAAKLHGRVGAAVVTVPANFSDAERRATMQAGEIAGFDVSHIINEPTAAALAYVASGSALSGRLMVYDLGGGTFDVTIAEVRGNDVEIITSEGDRELGGGDFDRKIYEVVRSLYKEQTGIDLPASPDLEGIYHQALAECEKLKIQLSKRDTARAAFSPSGKGQPMQSARIEIHRSDFERDVSVLISRAEMLVETALDSAGLEPQQINHVLLVGGTTRVPAVRESIRRIMGQNPLESVNPDEAVALGAAVYAGMKSGSLTSLQKERVQGMRLSEVANHYYGTISLSFDEQRGKEELVVSTIIAKDTPIPTEKAETFYTVAPNQTTIHVRITQSGENTTDPQFATIVEEFDFALPPGRPAQQPIKVTYAYDENQVMRCTFLDVNSGKSISRSVEIGNLTETKQKAASLKDFIVE